VKVIDGIEAQGGRRSRRSRARILVAIENGNVMAF
jgi:hypothetical protein